MKAVYLDNFRGFSEAVIPLEDVNFLVGENSTGKSSFLSLVNIISDPNFLWFHPNLKITDIDFGNFEDMVSVESDNKKEFTIGFVRQHHDENKKNEYAYLIVTYKKAKDRARPILFSYSENNAAITVKISNKKIGYKQNDLDNEEDPLNVFKAVIKAHKNENKGFSYIKSEKDHELPDAQDMPFFVMRELVKKHSKGLRDKKKSFSYTVPHPKERVIWLAPIREKPERIYDNIKPSFSPEGTHTPHLLNEVLNRGDKSTNALSQSLEKFGKESGLFKEVTSKRFGKSDASPFEIDITLSETPIKITNVGYGVAQVLPVIVESFIRGEDSTFCIQQPEVHLHPKAQAALGSFFYDLSRKENKSFLIETHSDFLMDRYRIKQAKGKKKSNSQVLYFERKAGQNIAHCIAINDDGSYSEEQPSSFRSFFFKEQLDLLDI